LLPVLENGKRFGSGEHVGGIEFGHCD
jgi:hypothetical protein